MIGKKLLVLLWTLLVMMFGGVSTQAANVVDLDYIEEYQNSRLVAGYKWHLAQSCNTTDICHMYAKVDMFSLGAGVFPKNLIPILPVHADCQCYLSTLTVYDIDTDKQRQQIDLVGNVWLGSLPEQEQQKLFSKADYITWRDTTLWQPFIKHWQGVAAPSSHSSQLLAMELNLRAPSDEFLHDLAINQGSKYTLNKQGADRYYDDAGEPIWPSNKGFYGKPKSSVLPAGKVVDKLGGYPRGKFLAAPEVRREERAIPNKGKYLTIYQTVHTFRVNAPLRVYAGLIAPWFEEVGMGVQYFVPQGIENTPQLKLLNTTRLDNNLKEAA